MSTLVVPRICNWFLTMTSHHRTRCIEQGATQRLITRAILTTGLLMIAALGPSAHAAGKDETKFKRLWTPQYIAALGDPRASS